MALNLIKKWFIKRSILSDRDDTGVTKSTALDLDDYIQYRIDNTSGVRPYKVYTALLTQTGTNAPVATILENTLGGTPVWSYSSTGSYIATLASAFTTNKTVVTFGNINSVTIVTGNQITANEVAIATFTENAGTFVTQDDLLSVYFIEIRVYP